MMDNVRLVFFYIIEVQQIAPARFGNADDGISLRKQLALPFHDERCIAKQVREPLVSAVMMGDNQPAATQERNSPIKHDMVNIKPSQRRRQHRGYCFVHRIAQVARPETSPPA